ncbi:hypothetical protein DVH24_030930 [Malus domestica]|uniref:F-box domain-containing protein n=1 Tax=Malus domestica TaxID=3750 RepID=A0A498HGZ8_MALDO|nr:hypothetical protein DVH24_030930 [Malus domestica]
MPLPSTVGIALLKFVNWGCMGDCVKSLRTKLLTVGPFKGIEFPLTLWKCDELLMLPFNGRATSNGIIDYAKNFLWNKIAEMSQGHKSETPQDMVVEILSRLPPKSLMRFQCICKSWCTLINSPSFQRGNLGNFQIFYLLLPEGKFELESTLQGMGFGYDCKAKEYKVVKIIENCEYSDDKRTYYHRIDLPHTAEKRIRFYRRESGFTFDNMFLYNESIASFCSPYHPSEDSGLLEVLEIWVMDNYEGAKRSWTKLLTVGPLKGNENLLTVWKSDKLLMVTSDKRVISYNSSSGNVKYLHIPPIINEVIDFQALIYVESIRVGSRPLHSSLGLSLSLAYWARFAAWCVAM